MRSLETGSRLVENQYRAERIVTYWRRHIPLNDTSRSVASRTGTTPKPGPEPDELPLTASLPTRTETGLTEVS